MNKPNLEVWTLEEMHKHWKADLVKLILLQQKFDGLVKSLEEWLGRSGKHTSGDLRRALEEAKKP